jgi:hypothetical protein
MSHDNENTPSFPVDQLERGDGLLIAPVLVAREEGALPSLAADRLYQLAAVTAGIFLLVTLL